MKLTLDFLIEKSISGLDWVGVCASLHQLTYLSKSRKMPGRLFVNPTLHPNPLVQIENPRL